MATVISAQLGIGTVISEENGNITVDFNGTVKTLIVKFARLTNEDGTAYGEQFTAKPKKEISKKKLAEKLEVSSNKPASWMNADGTKNWDKYNDFIEERERAAINSISW